MPLPIKTSERTRQIEEDGNLTLSGALIQTIENPTYRPQTQTKPDQNQDQLLSNKIITIEIYLSMKNGITFVKCYAVTVVDGLVPINIISDRTGVPRTRCVHWTQQIWCVPKTSYFWARRSYFLGSHLILRNIFL